MVTGEWDYSWILRKNLFLYRVLIAKFFQRDGIGPRDSQGYFQHYESRFSSSLTFSYLRILVLKLGHRWSIGKLIRTMTAELKVQIYIKRIQIRFIVRVKRFNISYFSRYSVLTELRYIAYRNRYILPIVSETETVLYTILPRDFGYEFIIISAA